MSPDLQERLIKKFPRMFKNVNNRFSPLVFGIECGDGWFFILEKLCIGIQQHINSSRNARARDLIYNRALKAGLAGNPKKFYSYFQYGIPTFKVDPWIVERTEREIEAARFKEAKPAVSQVHIDQIKEKFGSLRFYYSGGDEYIDGMVSMAESISYAICENCSKPGSRNRAGWISVRCQECRENETRPK